MRRNAPIQIVANVVRRVSEDRRKINSINADGKRLFDFWNLRIKAADHLQHVIDKHHNGSRVGIPCAARGAIGFEEVRKRLRLLFRQL